MPPTTTGTKTPNVNYRLDAPATPIGAAAKVRQSVPAPHANAMHAEAKKPLPRREPAVRQGNSQAAEAAPPKDTAKIAEAEAKAAKSFEDITRALSNLDRGNSANAEPEITAKDPFDIFDTLAFGMKQHAPAPVSPPEKKPAPEEAPIPNQFTSPNTSVAVEKKNAATGKGDILDKKSPASANVDSRENKHSYSAKSDAPGQINSYSGKSDTPEKQNPPDKPSVEESQPAPAIRLFQPMLQVDHFAWPKVCGRLEKGANAELDRIIEILIAANARGKKMFALGGCRSGDGATSLLLATARQMAAQGVKAVLVDADWSQPQLARRLGLLPQYGWEDVLAGRLPLEEVLIESVAERLVILPVREPFTASELPADAPNRIAETWESLRRHFDVVLIDSGPLANSPILDQRYVGVLAGRIEAVVMVKNLRRQDDDEFNATQQALNNAAAKVIGVIENFAGG
jgi:Mrp family chromosome partitioning ATPase